MPVIRFYDGSQQVYEHSVSLIEIIKNKKPSIMKSLIAISVNNHFSNLNTFIREDAFIEFVDQKNYKALNIIRYSCAQLLSYAIKNIWPLAQIATSNIIEDGFYCDIDFKRSISEKDLILLENQMKMLVKREYNILNKLISYSEAREIFQKCFEKYKVSLIDENINCNSKVSLYYHENYADIDIGLQVFNIKFCKYFKLQKIGGVYWKKNKNNKMLQRIYGTAWTNKQELDKHLDYLNELEKRDHRKIGKFLQLYHMQEESPGMIFWHNKGWIIFNELQNFVRVKLKEYKYEEVKTPLLIDKLIWKQSGHWDNYKNAIFTTLSEHREYCIKPMNCPGHVQIFNSRLKSYRDLPIRMAEFGSCHRNEPSGSLHGLMRVRNFTQDDAHIFCTREQVRSEINDCIKMIYDLYSTFHFKKILVKLSTRPEKRIGTDSLWNESEKDLSDMLIENHLSFEYQSGEGAFYGPKIEFILQDSLDRNWQCGTIQLDFYLPLRLSSFYINEKNEKKVPVIIHRAILGSIERFIGILIEECSGNLPTWLSPVQVVIISITDISSGYVKELFKKFSDVNIRIECDLRNEKIGFKIREHTLRRIPYILICGEKESSSKKISVRNRQGHNFGMIDVDFFIKKLQKEIITRNFYQMEE
ncbi:threonine--tRNA ligase [Buchnera aphidicola str. APS (Acyrthosiphon pisum)]|uniref:Threonine--tRNA ligase n=1 Tax=Buchnera aphidicola subsp. Acyrthosiphon pisum (strain APS) TaxID=107806 RepID=SYT_BUCAI|nr:threonine--tRNA ligase [Buchnera aphidicola]P57225.1 RecName: Full=Threonine--tRNA ligase; AltName: Full=Threonyl-tRNA synthetase; Short=ThrRS [Buchnera aphidicola str. APS (Acyrthosiphon pisum)]pir/C84944/ threonine-tRNA ligase (EC 6.1.1.3) [imported] - Buchnera sp. (strain APS) [Buchnera sp. (in: enterobacteria)]BAB12843.1 threonyl-tRNA synthetase [Buchnera aphidicola str. APS (Acyrthosiphon pisum)]